MEVQDKQKANLAAAREKLRGKTGKQYWRSLEEVAETDEFKAWMEDEFPNRKTLLEFDRRTFLKYAGASLALAGLTGCRGVFLPQEKVVPAVRQPEEQVPGVPLFYASTMPMAGYGIGVLVEQHDGRPTKIEGNPEHPESLGATNPQMQASILTMYDPDRSQAVVNEGDISTWDIFFNTMREYLFSQRATRGAGIRILTDTIASPTVAGQIQALLRDFPAARWHSWDASNRDAVRAGAVAAFGRPVNTVYDLTGASVIVSLDSNFLLTMPGSLRYARQWADGRRVESNGGRMNRLYQFETYPNITGASADHRWGVKPSDIPAIANALLSALNGGGAANNLPISAEHLAALVDDLRANPGAAVVIPGEGAPADVHAVCHAINQALGANGSIAIQTERIEFGDADQGASLRALTDDLNAGSVDLLLIVGGNPVYDAPSDLGFVEAMQKARLRVRYGYYADETSQLCQWHLPATHFLEEWGDIRSFDGTVSLIQPLIQPLFDGRPVVELFAGLRRDARTAHQILKESYLARLGGEQGWDEALHRGTIPNSAARRVTVTANAALARVPTASGVELVIQEDPSILDGRWANNGWLQELPKPLTKITWDNAVHISPAMAQRLGIANEDLVRLKYNGVTVEGGAWVMPGQADNVVVVHTGYGRRVEGLTVADGCGFNVYPMRRSDAMSYGSGASLEKVGSETYALATTQITHSMEGRDIVRSGTLAQYQADVEEGRPALMPENSHNEPEKTNNLSMYPDKVFNYEGEQWGMTIDQNTCIGCNACVVACNAENNIPVVGKVQVKRGRELHWLRIDRYYEGSEESPNEALFQPMMCVHCEKAPCEPVCPVAATIHGHDGLNMMIYNRCVGTRYCSNNCPYKVRRFNYLNYSDNNPQFTNTSAEGSAVAGKIATPKQQGIELLRMVNNPDVTVRGRGIMEKCTYCVQRISNARIEAKKAGREIQDGEVVTACQQACPTRTIVFGNVADKSSAVSQLRENPRSYLVLNELQTRPRTSHLARLRNPNPRIVA